MDNKRTEKQGKNHHIHSFGWNSDQRSRITTVIDGSRDRFQIFREHDKRFFLFVGHEAHGIAKGPTLEPFSWSHYQNQRKTKWKSLTNDPHKKSFVCMMTAPKQNAMSGISHVHCSRCLARSVCFNDTKFYMDTPQDVLRDQRSFRGHVTKSCCCAFLEWSSLRTPAKVPVPKVFVAFSCTQLQDLETDEKWMARDKFPPSSTWFDQWRSMQKRSDCSAHRKQFTIPITKTIAIWDLNWNQIKFEITGIKRDTHHKGIKLKR